MFAGFQNAGNYPQHQQHHKHNRHSSSANTSRDNSFFADSNIEAEEYLIDEENEDEDADNIAAAKYRLMARSHATHAYPAYPAILNYLCKSYKAIPSVCLPASDKNILQGVLRI